MIIHKNRFILFNKLKKKKNIYIFKIKLQKMLLHIVNKLRLEVGGRGNLISFLTKHDKIIYKKKIYI